MSRLTTARSTLSSCPHRAPSRTTSRPRRTTKTSAPSAAGRGRLSALPPSVFSLPPSGCVLLVLAAVGCGPVASTSGSTGSGGAGGSSSSTSGSGGSGGGSGAVVLVTATKPWGLTVDATSVVWTSSEEGTVAKVPLSGGDVTSLAMGQADA